MFTPHEACPLGTEHLAVVKRQASMVGEEGHKVVVRQTEGAEVHPYQERSLRLHHLYPGHPLGKELACEADILLYIVHRLGQPRLAVVVGGLGSDGRHKRGGVEFIGLEPLEERFAQTGILHHAP